MAVQTGASNQGQADNNFTTNAGAANAGASLNNGNAPTPGLFDFTQGLHSLPVSSTVGGQSIRDFMKTWEDMEKKDTAWEMQLLTIDNTRETGWFASSVIALVWAKEDAARNGGTPTKVASYPMLLAITEKRPLTSFMVKIRDLEYPVQEVASMAMNEQFQERVVALVNEHFGKQIGILHVPGMVVHKEVDLTKPDQVRLLIENAARACVTSIVMTMPAFVDADLSKLSPGSTQSMKIEATTQPLYDITGMPIRRDFTMTFSDRNSQRQTQTVSDRRSLNDVSGQETIWAQMSCFFDLTYNPPQSSLYQQGIDQDAMTRCFVPRAIVTDIDHKQLPTVASTMLMLATTTALAQPQVWLGLMYQRSKNFSHHLDGKGKVPFDPTDLGTLNQIAGAVKVKGEAHPYDLKSNDVSTDEFVKYAQKILVPQMHIAIDVPHAGPKSFFQGIISSAANGDITALRKLVAHMDKLTGGLFSKKYLNGNTENLTPEQFFSETNNTTPAGYAYQKGPDDTLVKVDLRTVDYLYVANRFKNDPITLKKWSQSFLVGELDVAKRLGQRMDVLNAVFSGVVVNGYFERHTFRADMLVALFSCMIDLKVRPELRYIDPLRDAAAGENAPAFVRQTGLQQGMLSTTGGFSSIGGGTNSGLGNSGLGGGAMGRWS